MTSTSFLMEAIATNNKFQQTYTKCECCAAVCVHTYGKRLSCVLVFIRIKELTENIHMQTYTDTQTHTRRSGEKKTCKKSPNQNEQHSTVNATDRERTNENK